MSVYGNGWMDSSINPDGVAIPLLSQPYYSTLLGFTAVELTVNGTRT